MQKDRNSSIFYFDYMKGSLPPWKWLGLILLALSIAVILFLGMGTPNSFFYTQSMSVVVRKNLLLNNTCV